MRRPAVLTRGFLLRFLYITEISARNYLIGRSVNGTSEQQMIPMGCVTMRLRKGYSCLLHKIKITAMGRIRLSPY